MGVGFPHWLYGAESPTQWYCVATDQKAKLVAACRVWSWEFVPSLDGFGWVQNWLAPNVVGHPNPNAVRKYYLDRGFTWLRTDDYPPEPPPLS